MEASQRISLEKLDIWMFVLNILAILKKDSARENESFMKKWIRNMPNKVFIGI